MASFCDRSDKKKHRREVAAAAAHKKRNTCLMSFFARRILILCRVSRAGYSNDMQEALEGFKRGLR